MNMRNKISKSDSLRAITESLSSIALAIWNRAKRAAQQHGEETRPYSSVNTLNWGEMDMIKDFLLVALSYVPEDKLPELAGKFTQIYPIFNPKDLNLDLNMVA